MSFPKLGVSARKKPHVPSRERELVDGLKKRSGDLAARWEVRSVLGGGSTDAHPPAAKACLAVALHFQEQHHLLRTKPEIRHAAHQALNWTLLLSTLLGSPIPHARAVSAEAVAVLSHVAPSLVGEGCAQGLVHLLHGSGLPVGAHAAAALTHMLSEWRLALFWPVWESQGGTARLLDSIQETLPTFLGERDTSKAVAAAAGLAAPLLQLLLIVLRTARGQVLGDKEPSRWARVTDMIAHWAILATAHSTPSCCPPQSQQPKQQAHATSVAHSERNSVADMDKIPSLAVQIAGALGPALWPALSREEEKPVHMRMLLALEIILGREPSVWSGKEADTWAESAELLAHPLLWRPPPTYPQTVPERKPDHPAAANGHSSPFGSAYSPTHAAITRHLVNVALHIGKGGYTSPKVAAAVVRLAVAILQPNLPAPTDMHISSSSSNSRSGTAYAASTRPTTTIPCTQNGSMSSSSPEQGTHPACTMTPSQLLLQLAATSAPSKAINGLITCVGVCTARGPLEQARSAVPTENGGQAGQQHPGLVSQSLSSNQAEQLHTSFQQQHSMSSSRGCGTEDMEAMRLLGWQLLRVLSEAAPAELRAWVLQQLSMAHSRGALPPPATAATLMLLSPPSLTHTALDPAQLASFSAVLAWGAHAWGVGSASASLGHSALAPYNHDPFGDTPSPGQAPGRAGFDSSHAIPADMHNGGPGARRVVDGPNAWHQPAPTQPASKGTHGAATSEAGLMACVSGVPGVVGAFESRVLWKLHLAAQHACVLDLQERSGSGTLSSGGLGGPSAAPSDHPCKTHYQQHRHHHIQQQQQQQQQQQSSPPSPAGTHAPFNHNHSPLQRSGNPMDPPWAPLLSTAAALALVVVSTWASTPADSSGCAVPGAAGHASVPAVRAGSASRSAAGGESGSSGSSSSGSALVALHSCLSAVLLLQHDAPAGFILASGHNSSFHKAKAALESLVRACACRCHLPSSLHHEPGRLELDFTHQKDECERACQLSCVYQYPPCPMHATPWPCPPAFAATPAAQHPCCSSSSDPGIGSRSCMGGTGSLCGGSCCSNSSRRTAPWGHTYRDPLTSEVCSYVVFNIASLAMAVLSRVFSQAGIPDSWALECGMPHYLQPFPDDHPSLPHLSAIPAAPTSSSDYHTQHLMGHPAKWTPDSSTTEGAGYSLGSSAQGSSTNESCSLSSLLPEDGALPHAPPDVCFSFPFGRRLFAHSAMIAPFAPVMDRIRQAQCERACAHAAWQLQQQEQQEPEGGHYGIHAHYTISHTNTHSAHPATTTPDAPVQIALGSSVPPSAFYCLLRFLYTGCCTLQGEVGNRKPLLHLARALGLPALAAALGFGSTSSSFTSGSSSHDFGGGGMVTKAGAKGTIKQPKGGFVPGVCDVLPLLPCYTAVLLPCSAMPYFAEECSNQQSQAEHNTHTAGECLGNAVCDGSSSRSARSCTPSGSEASACAGIHAGVSSSDEDDGSLDDDGIVQHGRLGGDRCTEAYAGVGSKHKGRAECEQAHQGRALIESGLGNDEGCEGLSKKNCKPSHVSHPASENPLGQATHAHWSTHSDAAQRKQTQCKSPPSSHSFTASEGLQQGAVEEPPACCAPPTQLGESTIYYLSPHGVVHDHTELLPCGPPHHHKHHDSPVHHKEQHLIQQSHHHHGSQQDHSPPDDPDHHDALKSHPCSHPPLLPLLQASMSWYTSAAARVPRSMVCEVRGLAKRQPPASRSSCAGSGEPPAAAEAAAAAAVSRAAPHFGDTQHHLGQHQDQQSAGGCHQGQEQHHQRTLQQPLQQYHHHHLQHRQNRCQEGGEQCQREQQKQEQHHRQSLHQPPQQQQHHPQHQPQRNRQQQAPRDNLCSSTSHLDGSARHPNETKVARTLLPHIGITHDMLIAVSPVTLEGVSCQSSTGGVALPQPLCFLLPVHRLLLSAGGGEVIQAMCSGRWGGAGCAPSQITTAIEPETGVEACPREVSWEQQGKAYPEMQLGHDQNPSRASSIPRWEDHVRLQQQQRQQHHQQQHHQQQPPPPLLHQPHAVRFVRTLPVFTLPEAYDVEVAWAVVAYTYTGQLLVPHMHMLSCIHQEEETHVMSGCECSGCTDGNHNKQGVVAQGEHHQQQQRQHQHQHQQLKQPVSCQGQQQSSALCGTCHAVRTSLRVFCASEVLLLAGLQELCRSAVLRALPVLPPPCLCTLAWDAALLGLEWALLGTLQCLSAWALAFPGRGSSASRPGVGFGSGSSSAWLAGLQDLQEWAQLPEPLRSDITAEVASSFHQHAAASQ